MGELIKLSYDEVISILDGVEKCGEGVKALCPAHTDIGKSLTMKRGYNNEAVCHCFAGCNASQIFKAVRERLNKPIEFENDKPISKKQGFYKEVARYDYFNENGVLVDTKIRQFNSTLSKKKFYWKNGNDKRKESLPLFNLKEVIEKNPIYIVEGEKDVLTIKTLGFGATTSKKENGFTLDNAKRYLSDKDIIVIPDNDDKGLNIALEAADICYGIAKSVKIIDLKSLWADIPEKADITDYIENGFSFEQVIEKVNTLEEYKEESHHSHADIWKAVEGYSLNGKNQIVFNKSEDESIPLCHGSIVITEEIHNNDGVNDMILFRCSGITESGEPMKDIVIPADEFDSLKWISKRWGCSIVPFGTQSTTQRLIAGIKLTGRNAKIIHQKCHTGFVLDASGKPKAYLHAGGSIGDQSIISDLTNELQQYRLSGCSINYEEQKESFLASLSLLHAHRESVVFPLLSLVYMPPLREINKEVNGECGFCLYLRGKTQSGKSTLAALAMSHFGRFTSTTPPTSFESTWNRNEYLSFILKDNLLWLDDFHPHGSKKARDSQNEQMNHTARAAGDLAVRGRLNSNSELMRAYKPRCLYLVTGEDNPQISQSGLARIFTIDVKSERKDLSKLFRASRKGILSRAMSDYISYIIKNYDAVKSEFESMYDEVIATTRTDIGENRLSIQAALLITSFGMWLSYAQKNSLIDPESAKALYIKNGSIVMGLASKNSNEIASSDPAEKFITTLSSMISNREVELRAIRSGDDDNELFNDLTQRIGWYDERFYYLDKMKTYAAVKHKLESIDDFIGLTIEGLFRELSDSKRISGDGNSYTRVKNINGKNKRVIWIERTILDSGNK